MEVASPKTPSARKALPPAARPKSRSTKASPASGQKQKGKGKAGVSEESPASGRKRKSKTDVSPKNATPKSKSAGAAGQTPGKKQKVDHDQEQIVLIDDAIVPFPPFESQPQLYPQTPVETPFHTSNPSPQYLANMTRAHPEQASFQNAFRVGTRQQQFPSGMSEQHQQPSSRTHHQQHQQQHQPAESQAGIRGIDQDTKDLNASLLWFDKIIAGTLKQFRIDENGTITGAAIDQATYLAYQSCIEYGLLALLGKYSAMMNEVKLRALALLNLIAGWWFLRERLLRILIQRNLKVDDSVMQNGIKDAVAQVNRWRSDLAANENGGSTSSS